MKINKMRYKLLMVLVVTFFAFFSRPDYSFASPHILDDELKVVNQNEANYIQKQYEEYTNRLSLARKAGEGELVHMQQKWKSVFKEWKLFLSFLAGFGALTSFLVFIFLMVKLGISGANPYERAEAFKEIAVLLIVTALLGSASIFFALFSQTVLL